MNIIIATVILLGVAGGFAGVLLAISSRVFAVKVDPQVAKIEEILPGVNCGGCGNPSCYMYAKKIVEEGAPPNLCVADPNCVEKIGGALGIEVTSKIPLVAAIRCYGGSTSQKKFDYGGYPACRFAVLMDGGDNRCRYSCMGFGDCVRVCPFDALSRDGRNTPVVDLQKCTGCGNCVKECPRCLIILMPFTSRPHIACNTCEKGKTVREICQIGCITCGKCVKVCPDKAIEMVDNRPVIDYKKCTNCGTCIENCPRKIIRDMIPAQQIKAAV